MVGAEVRGERVVEARQELVMTPRQAQEQQELMVSVEVAEVDSAAAQAES